MDHKIIQTKLSRTTKNQPHNLKQKLFTQYFNEESFDQVQSLVLPRKGLFNVVNLCNANCVFCAYQYREDENSIMSNELFDKATRMYAEFHPQSFISLTPTVGDPLIDKDVFKKVEIAKANGIKRVQFYTNAILLKKRMKDLLDSPLDNLEVSLADFDKNEYFKIYRTDKYKVVLDGLHLLLKTLKENNSDLVVDINLRHRRPLAEILSSPDYLTYIKPYLTDYVTITNTETFDNWMGMIKSEDLPKGMKLAEDYKQIDQKPCSRLFDLQFLQNGDVRICGCRFKTTVFDELVIGNIQEKSLSDIWFSEKVFNLRNDFFKGQFPEVCKSCSFYTRLGTKRFFVKNLEQARKLRSN